MRDTIGIEGREYKLLLDPDAFAGAPEKVARRFWEGSLRRLIEEKLGEKEGGGSRAEGELKLKKQRIVTFLDSKKRFLNERKFALRRRITVENGEPAGAAEVTLKFRTPDLLLAADYGRAAKKCPGETALEEDIAPLEVSRGKKGVAVADPPSTYSRFSVSTKLAANDSFETLGDAFDRYEVLEDALERQIGRKADGSLKLIPGPTIFEWVFQEAAVDLGEKLDAEFGFTLWYFSTGKMKSDPWGRTAFGAVAPTVAEISFDFETKGGRMDADAAMRASKLFIAMQQKLPANPREASKTTLGLP